MQGVDEAALGGVGARSAVGLLLVNSLQNVKEPTPVLPLSSPVPQALLWDQLQWARFCCWQQG